MKKWITMALCLLLTGCSTPAPESQAPVEEVPPTATETPVEETPMVEMPADEVREAAFHYEADTTLFADILYAEDGTPLLNYTVRVPVLTVWREDGTQVTTAETETEKQALSAAETFGARFADWYQPENYAEMKAAAAEQLEWYRQEGMEWAGGYFMELDCSVYQTERLVSVSGACYSYTGGAHPNTYLLGWTFDVKNGVFFGVESLAGQDELQRAVGEELARQAEEKAAEYELEPNEFFWPEYETILADWPSYAISFDENGMWVRFSPYELAAYAAGAQEFHIPYTWLKPYLDEHSLEVLKLN